jgi:O-antigen ligase
MSASWVPDTSRPAARQPTTVTRRIRRARPLRPFSRGGDVAMRESVYYLLVAFWFTLPFEGTIRVGGETIAKGVGALLAVSAVVTVLMTGRRGRINEFVVLLVVFASWVAVSMFWSMTPGISKTRTITMAELAIMALITWEFAQSRRQVFSLLRAWVGGSTVVGLVVVSAFVTGQAETRYAAPGVSHGDIAYALLLAIPMAWYLSLTTRRTALVWAYRLFVPFACFATLLTASRAGLLSMGFALLIIPATYRSLSGAARVTVAAVTGLAVVAFLALTTLASGPLARLATTGDELTSGTLDQRTDLWAIGGRLMTQHPVLGLGAGGSKQAVSGQFYVARGLHNTFLSIGVELGVIGIALFLVLGLAATYRALTRLPWLETRLAWVLLTIFLISLVPRHGDYFKSTYAILALFALMGEVLARSPRARRRTASAQTGPAPAATRSASARSAGSAE